MEDLGDEGLNRAKEDARARQLAALQPYQYKKGQSGNPAGRPAGISLKEYAKMMLSRMTDGEREEFMNGLSKETIWKMAEGNHANNTDITSKGEAIMGNAIVFSEFKDDTKGKQGV